MCRTSHNVWSTITMVCLVLGAAALAGFWYVANTAVPAAEVEVSELVVAPVGASVTGGDSSATVFRVSAPQSWNSSLFGATVPPLRQRIQCIQNTYPVFVETECDEWQCRDAGDLKLPFPCCLTTWTALETLQLLNGSEVHFIGDSTARRASHQLAAFLTNEPFTDAAEHTSVTHAVADPVTGLRTNIVSHWLPFVSYLKSALQSAGEEQTVPTLLYSEEAAHQRKVFVLHFSTHDTQYVCWAKRTAASALEFVTMCDEPFGVMVNLLTRSIGMLKSARGFDASRDAILVRLPVAEECRARVRNDCYNSSGIDVLNKQLARLHELMVETLSRDHPDVALLDVLSWTAAPTGGRTACTPADFAGIHFATDAARMAYVQQVLHAVSMMVADKVGWPGAVPPPPLLPTLQPNGTTQSM